MICSFRPSVLALVFFGLSGCSLADPAGGGKDVPDTVSIDLAGAPDTSTDDIVASDTTDPGLADLGAPPVNVQPLACPSSLVASADALLTGVRVADVAVDGVGNVFLAGAFQQFEIGGQTVVAADSFDAFILSLDLAGKVRWVRTLGSTGISGAHAVAVDGAGNVFVIGEFQGTVAGPIPLANAGKTDVFVLSYDNGGTLRWARAYGDEGLDWGQDIAVGPDGLVIAGAFDDHIDFGGGAVTPDGPTAHSSGGQFLAAITTEAGHLWSKGFPYLGNWGLYVAIGSDGRAFLGGQCRSAFAWVGGDEFDCDESGDPFVAAYDADGKNAWTMRWKGAGFGGVRDVAVAKDGTIALIGAFSGTLDLGAGIWTAADQSDVFVMRLDAAGKSLASRSLGFMPSEGAHGVAALSDGRVAVTGSVRTTSLGPGAPAPTEDTDLFVLVFDAELGCDAVLRSGTEFSDIGMAVAVGTNDRLVVAGSVNLVDSVVLKVDSIP